MSRRSNRELSLGLDAVLDKIDVIQQRVNNIWASVFPPLVPDDGVKHTIECCKAADLVVGDRVLLTGGFCWTVEDVRTMNGEFFGIVVKLSSGLMHTNMNTHHWKIVPATKRVTK